MCATRVLVAATSVILGIGAAIAADAQPQRIRIEYVKPDNPAHQPLLELMQQRRMLEKVQELFSPYRLPTDVTIKTVGCNGQSNAWYLNATLSLCYEYLEEMRQSMPKETTPAGVTPQDAVAGQFFYVVAHEFGHAVFDLLDVPAFGNAEDVADQFSAYTMLALGKDDARRLIGGAAYSYRFYNLLCMAYGADPVLFKDIVEHKYLPKERAANCNREYNQVGFAFQRLIAPHVDKDLAEKVMDRTWLPTPGKVPAR